MQALYMEDQYGKEKYHEYMNNMKRFTNVLAVAPKALKTSQEIYKAPIYNKGAWILHNLRYVMGDEAFFKALRLMCYPSPELEKVTDGSHTRFVSTADFQTLCENLHGKPLDWFFENYLRQPQLPVLTSRIENNTLRLQWQAPVGDEFPLAIEIELNPGEIKRFEIPKEGLNISLKNNQKPVVDPFNWLLFEKG
jgi:aminopeptidase N